MHAKPTFVTTAAKYDCGDPSLPELCPAKVVSSRVLLNKPISQTELGISCSVKDNIGESVRVYLSFPTPP
ncbi:hypothetical protein ASC97_19420 [Rhizobium sp. Root1203]|nr:hypothetical protein ASC97_19420 [Rhizobium sp. Root1203]